MAGENIFKSGPVCGTGLKFLDRGQSLVVIAREMQWSVAIHLDNKL
jgi:hypothetical protein